MASLHQGLHWLLFAPPRQVRIAAIATGAIILVLNLYAHTSIVLNTPRDVVADMPHFVVPRRSKNGRTLRLDKDVSERMEYSVRRNRKYAITKASVHTCFDGNRNVTIPQVPSFIIVGAQKSGTSSMFNYLLQHPNVVPTKNFIKTNGTSTEMHFFDWHYVKRNGAREMQFWKENNITKKEEFRCLMRQRYANFWESDELFAAANGTLDLRVTFEKTPVYLFLPYAPIFIKETCPWLTKLVVILRNPIDRAYSHYFYEWGTTSREMESFEERINRELEYMRSKGLTQTPNITKHNVEHFDDSTEFPPNNCTRTCEDKWFMQNYEQNFPRYSNLLRGVYGMQLRQWLKYYKAHENLLVINYDDLLRDTRGVYERILRHVGLPQHHLESMERRLQLSDLYPPMAKGTRRFLQKFYEPYNAQLADLLGEEWRGVWKE